MAWRRRRAGRPRKAQAQRYPSGGVVHERIVPPPEVLARRAGFGAEVGETDWVIDQWWARQQLDDRERRAAHRLNALMRARLARIGAPRAASMAFHDARGPSVFAEVKSAADQIAALKAAIDALQALDAGACHKAVYDAVVYNRQADIALVRVGLAAVAAAFARPLPRQLGVDAAREAGEKTQEMQACSLRPVDR